MKVLVLGARLDSAARIKNKLRGISDDVEAKILVANDLNLPATSGTERLFAGVGQDNVSLDGGDKVSGSSEKVRGQRLHPDLIVVPEIAELLARGKHDVVLLEDGDGAGACLAEIRERGSDGLLAIIVGDWLLDKDVPIPPYFACTSDMYLNKGAVAVLSLLNSHLYWKQLFRTIQLVKEKAQVSK